MRYHTMSQVMWCSTAEVVLVVVHMVRVPIVMVAAAVALVSHLFMVHIFPQVVQDLHDFALTCCYCSFMFW